MPNPKQKESKRCAFSQFTGPRRRAFHRYRRTWPRWNNTAPPWAFDDGAVRLDGVNTMPSEAQSAPVSKGLFWTGWVMSALPALFLLVDGAMKLVQPEVVVKTTVDLGYAEAVILPLGIVLLACTILYLIPRTAVFGAILLTGYLGGAVATHVRAGHGPVEIFFPVVVGALRGEGACGVIGEFGE